MVAIATRATSSECRNSATHLVKKKEHAARLAVHAISSIPMTHSDSDPVDDDESSYSAYSDSIN
jgi:hypothetical protein